MDTHLKEDNLNISLSSIINQNKGLCSFGNSSSLFTAAIYSAMNVSNNCLSDPLHHFPLPGNIIRCFLNI